jgi:histone-lysine N-methyltransferase SETMAR
MLTDQHKMNKQHGMISGGVVILHDNARPHTLLQRKISSRHLAGNNSIIPYSPDLAPSDFHVFLHLKTFLGGQQLCNDEDKEAVNTWFASQAASFYNVGIQKLVSHYDECLNNGGNYFEK